MSKTAQQDTPCVIHIESLGYPEVARAAHVEGAVALRLNIGSDGRVKSIAKLDGPDILAAAAEANASTWVFSSDRERTSDVQYEYRLEPAAASERVTPEVRFDLPSHVLILMPARPIYVN